MNGEVFRFFDTARTLRIIDELNSGKSMNLSNVKNGLKGFLSMFVKNGTAGHVVYLCPTDREAADKAAILKNWGGHAVLYFPAIPVHDYFADAHSQELNWQRMEVFDKIAGRGRYLICTSMEALIKKMPEPGRVKSEILTLRAGKVIEIGALAEALVDRGYVAVDQVESRGQFARRGGILDVFPVTGDQGLRFDFFDDEIETMVELDVATQRSGKALRSARILPVSETTLTAAERAEVLALLEENGGEDGEYRDLIETIRIEEGEHDETLTAVLQPEASFLDYLGDGTIVFWDEPERARDMTDIFLKKAWDDFEGLIRQGMMLPEERDRFFDFAQVEARVGRQPTLGVRLFADSRSRRPGVDMDSRSIESFAGRIPYFCQFVERHLAEDYRIVICCNNKKTMAAMKRFLTEQELNRFGGEDEPGIYLVSGRISEGFDLPAEKLVVIGESEIFKEQRVRGRKRKHQGRKIDSFSSLSVGDYVVHDIHGIGVYRGIEQMTIGDNTKDMMVIAYKDDDRLYLPVEEMDAVQAYISTGGDRKPKINTLGRPEWAKTKARAKKAVEDMADELIALYAKRRATPGYAFGPDTAWQKEFEDSFEYQETDDQLRCVEEIKQDMEQPIPMDRLLCGDVGYGKTEVALRAAFKTIMENKQVAILAPTTILAQQHYNTIRERFAHFPITVEVLSRFRTAKEQKAVIPALRSGRVDIVVGTHRLLSQDVVFKDLGLLIVDEEQRFGVRSKEQLKSLRENVDVLTLSATPIPRTLHMSMTGIRDMSVIEEPPLGRRPVQTYVMEYNPVVLSDAIEREIHRGGQVFFVHNRINDIHETAQKVGEMAPDARIVVAHGRMTGAQLEDIMVDFVDREYNVLVTTAIVESGMDVRNANTMIVDNGDAMGLSQLYQLRGRVGRSDVQAYCYIVHRRQVLSEVAQKRLKAIKDFTAFGSGFKIAMRDLEIRGAGNLLGAEQSGHLFNIGYEMYCRILEETITEHMGGQVRSKAERPPVRINVDINAFIPERYIDSEIVKYDVYKKIATIQNEKDLAALEEEIGERFGPPPQGVRNLLVLSLLGSMAGERGIEEIRQRGGKILFYFYLDTPLELPDGQAIQSLYEEFGVKFTADRRRDKVWSIELGHRTQDKMLKRVVEFLKKI